MSSVVAFRFLLVSVLHYVVADVRDGDVHSHGAADLHGEDGHAHGDELWEWAGLFELASGTYRWTFSAIDGIYGANDASMRLVLLRTGDVYSDHSVLYNMHGAAEALFRAGNCMQKNDGGDVIAGDTFYDLSFDAAAPSTTFTMRVPAPGRIAVYTQHQPSEFRAGTMKAPSGLDQGPVKSILHSELHEDGAAQHTHEADGHEHVLTLAAIAIATFAAFLSAIAIINSCYHSRLAHPLIVSTTNAAKSVRSADVEIEDGKASSTVEDRRNA